MPSSLRSPPVHMLRDLHELRWGVRIAIPFFILLFVPIGRFAFGMTWAQILYLGLGIFTIGQAIFHIALQRFLRLQKRSRYPASLAMELGTVQDLRQCADLSTRLVADWLGARAAVLAWLDEEGHTIPACSHGLSQASLGVGAIHLADVPFGRFVREGRSVLVGAREVPQWVGVLDRRGCVAVVPLTALGRTTGVLFLVTDRWTADLRDRKLLDSLGGVVGLSLETLRLAAHEYRSIMQALCNALDMRDKAAKGHSRRVARMAALLAEQMGLPGDEVRRIRQAVALHDIGEIGVPDAILYKPGPLTQEESIEVRRHPGLGFEIVAGIDTLQYVAEIIHCHHERYDGGGYPRGLQGREIPVGACILSVIDSYDAMTSHRPYRSARSHEYAIDEIIRNAGTQFDPAVVRAFVEVERMGLVAPHDVADVRGTPDRQAVVTGQSRDA